MTNKLLSFYNYPPAIPPTLPHGRAALLPGCQNLTQAGKLEQAGKFPRAGGPAPWAAHPPASWRNYLYKLENFK